MRKLLRQQCFARCLIDFLQTFDFLNSLNGVRYIALSLGHNNISFLTFLPCFFLLLLLVIFLLFLTIRLLILPLHLVLLLALISSSVLVLAGVLTELLQFLFVLLLMFVFRLLCLTLFLILLLFLLLYLVFLPLYVVNINRCPSSPLTTLLLYRLILRIFYLKTLNPANRVILV
jgi:hypothetical protein